MWARRCSKRQMSHNDSTNKWKWWSILIRICLVSSESVMLSMPQKIYYTIALSTLLVLISIKFQRRLKVCSIDLKRWKCSTRATGDLPWLSNRTRWGNLTARKKLTWSSLRKLDGRQDAGKRLKRRLSVVKSSGIPLTSSLKKGRLNRMQLVSNMTPPSQWSPRIRSTGARLYSTDWSVNADRCLKKNVWLSSATTQLMRLTRRIWRIGPSSGRPNVGKPRPWRTWESPGT